MYRPNRNSRYSRRTQRLRSTVSSPVKNSPDPMQWEGGLSNEEVVEKAKSLKKGEKWTPPVSGYCSKCEPKHKQPPPSDDSEPPEEPEKVVELKPKASNSSSNQQQPQPQPQQPKKPDKDDDEEDEKEGKDDKGKKKKEKDEDEEAEEGEEGEGKDECDEGKDESEGGEEESDQEEEGGGGGGEEKQGEDAHEERAEEAKEAEEQEEEDAETVSPEDVEGAKEGADDVNEEFKNAEKVQTDQDTPFFEPVVAATDPTVFRDLGFISEMNTALRDWRTGFMTKHGASGSKLSVKEYIRTKGEEPFISRVQQSAAGRKILLIADFSGSICTMQDSYKRAIVSTMEVLDGIGSQTALFSFGGQTGDPEAKFLRVKKFEEPKWLPVHAARASALEAAGGTPTDKAYAGLAEYIRKHKPDVTLTLTDGSPDDEASTINQIRSLKPNTRMVAFGIGENLEGAKNISEQLNKFGYAKVFGVYGISGLPNKVVNLIAPNR
jgi:uncharacterized protein with von Willebrand factor type A (vWA) domain